MPGGKSEVFVSDFTVTVNGARLSRDYQAAVERIEVKDEVNVPTMFSMDLSMLDFNRGSYMGADLRLFRPGATVQVSMGINKPALLVTGEIMAVEPAFAAYSTLSVRGYDRLYRMRFGRKTRSFTDKKVSVIAGILARDAGLRARQIDDTTTIYPYLCQNNESDYEFLQALALRENYEATVENNFFSFRRTREGLASSLTLQYGVDLDEFRPRLRVLTEGSRVAVIGWDLKRKEPILGEALKAASTYKMGGRQTGAELSRSVRASPTALTGETVLSRADARHVAQSRYELQLNEFIEGSGVLAGNPDIRAGTNVTVTGIGERFSGKYYVTQSAHVFEKGQGYSTTINVRRTGI